MPDYPSEVAWETKRSLIIGRASPEPSKKHLETVCTGGITEEGQLLRLYPIPLRYLEQTQRYKLWTWAEFDVQKSPDDKRKESYKVRDGSIKVLGEIKSKSERLSFLQKAIVPDRETLERLYHQDWTSLGVIEIDLLDFKSRSPQKNWEKDKPYIRQFNLYVERKPLEQTPIEMVLGYRCKNNLNCKTHTSILIGWEYMEAFRNFRKRYGTGKAAFEQINAALRRRFSDPKLNAYALVGTHYRYGSWMVAQLYFFERNTPSTLELVSKMVLLQSKQKKEGSRAEESRQTKGALAI